MLTAHLLQESSTLPPIVRERNMQYLSNDDSQDKDSKHVADYLSHVLHCGGRVPQLLLMDVGNSQESKVETSEIPATSITQHSWLCH